MVKRKIVKRTIAKLSIQFPLFFMLAIGSIGCSQKDAKLAPSDPASKSRSADTQSAEKSTDSRSETSPQKSDRSTASSPETKTENSSNSPASEASKQSQNAQTLPPTVKPEYQFEPTIDRTATVGNFEFVLRKVSVKKAIVDTAAQKNYDTTKAETPSSYIFVELDLNNKSDKPAFDLFQYRLDCGEETPIESAAAEAVAYRNNSKLDIFAEIKPGTKGTVADGFIVPDACLKEKVPELVIFSQAEGTGNIPLDLDN
jgi:hypothetical protein